jgi:hypothetical protein
MRLVDWSTAALSIVNFLLTAGMLIFAVKLARTFGRSSAGKAWRYFVVATAIGVLVTVIALAAALDSLDLPAWWREGGSIVFRAALAYAIYHFYKAWTKLGQ